MKALVKTSIEPGNVVYKDIPTPEPAPGQVRIKIKRSGICQTDNVYINEGGFALKPPVVLGHEVAGVIDKLGEGVTGFEIGQRVITQTTYHVCGKCRYCKRGELNHCPERRGIGSAANGGFAEYVVNRAESIMPLPDDLTFDQGACVEPLACGVHALTERTVVNAGSVVLVLGPGPIGLFAAQVAKAQGAYVIVGGTTSDKPRLELAMEKLNMDMVVDVEKDDVPAIVRGLTEGFGADVVVEATGARSAVALAMEVVCRRGVFIPMGIFNNDISVDFHNIKKKELDVHGSHAQIPTAWHRAITMLQRGQINTEAIVSHVFPLSEWEAALEVVLNRSGLKVLFDPER
ncbi:zinc-binding dehydrogenase [Eubacteriales bacterium OttesenSCG-928-K08]|nr:zinc-binding dehydrogenase [Eubacteriales bacterium OttesenSCG-928-K08]